MQVEKAIGEIERLIAKGRRQSVGDKYWREQYDAELRGVVQARADLEKATRIGTDPVQFMRGQLRGLDALPDWSTSLEVFERSIAVRMGYKEVVDALVMSRAEERAHPGSVARAVRDRPDLDLDL
jgi:hypothetical protein